jgi:hypothetical protein
MYLHRRPQSRPLHPRRSSGQSITEFAIVVPVMILVLLAVADFGRLYTSTVAVESAGREAADFGAFDTSHWDDSLGGGGNVATTVGLMQERACVAAAGSHLEGYQSSDPDNKTCTNPTFACTLEFGGASADCATSAGLVGSKNCSDPDPFLTEPPCTVHVQLVYEFRTLLGIPPLPDTITVTRDSRFRISHLTAPTP